MVIEPKESTKDPITDEIEHVVGLEHIDPENIHLNRSASIEESTTFTKKFSVGDILFGRRRAYLKKAAQASFGGICSGDITVMRSNENLMPELLPFIVNNEKFFDYAVKHSAGGLSPRVKFKDIAKYELLLPPKEEQAKLAKLLWTLNELIEKDNIILNNLHTLQASVRKREISILKGEKILLDKIIPPMSKIEVGKIEKSKYNEIGKYPIIDQSLNFISGYTEDQNLVYKGDLPVIVFDDHTTILKFIDFPFVMGADGTKVIKPTNINVYYLYQLLLNLNIKSEGYKRHFSILKSKTIEVTKDDKLIKSFNNLMLNIDESIRNCEAKISSAKNLQKNLINQIF